MKSADFRYECPETLADALALIGEDAMPLAGGQSLMPMMNFRLARPELLVDLNRITGLSGVTDGGDHIRIGAMTRYSDLMGDPLIADHVPLFGKALPHIAHAAIRNRGTIGGSVGLADPAAEMPALLLALGAVITVQSAATSRDIPADDFFLGLYDTAREPDELVTDIRIPKSDARFGFYELARRHGDYAMAGVAVAMGDETRAAFFSVSDRAIRVAGVEEALPDVDKAVASLAEIEFAADQNAGEDMKRHLAGVVLRRAIGGMA